MKKLSILVRAIYLLLIIFILTSCTKKENYVVMLSLDGFRWDYAARVPTPNLDYIARNGVKAESLKPSFPSKTFPNHYSIATGLYPDHHGIVNNNFYDPRSEREYKISDRKAVEDGYFYGGEPLWVTAEKQNMKSATFFWVGSEAAVQETRPTYWKKYDGKIPLSQSIDTVVYWLQLPVEKRPRLVLFYSSEPDHSGHDFGPESVQVDSQIVRLDSLIGVFLTKLKSLPVYNQVNFIVVSDHGMASVSKDKTTYLSDHIQESWFDHIEGYNPVYTFQPKPENKIQAIQAMKDIEHVRAWEKDSLPAKWHYGTNIRIQDIVMVADNGWQIKDNRQAEFMKGDHGYDNDFRDMHAIFYAIGPAFKSGYQQPTFKNTEIYNLICHILGLQPANNDGDLEHVSGLLKK
jgi:predicted AlkP superfamily pyrophosphatase or phosphodiesterase